MENNFKDWSIEELKTSGGLLMCDLRGSWGWNYEVRLIELQRILDELVIKDPENKDSYIADISIVNDEILEPFDGRVFRDCACLYNYSSNEGKTLRVKEFIDGIMNYPEYNTFEIKDYNEPTN